jgi:hypothetical protein
LTFRAPTPVEAPRNMAAVVHRMAATVRTAAILS